MRNLLVLSALLGVTATSHPAPACGYDPIHAFLVSEHYIPHHGGEAANRTFALTDRTPAPTDGWQLVAPRSYDNTQFVDDRKADTDYSFTLLGDHVSLNVASSKRVFIRNSWDNREAMHGYELTTDGKDYAIAVPGSHVDLSFERMENVAAGIDRAGDAETTTSFEDGAFKTEIRRDGHVVGTYAGTPFGRLAADGMEYLLVRNDGELKSVMLR